VGGVGAFSLIDFSEPTGWDFRTEAGVTIGDVQFTGHNNAGSPWLFKSSDIPAGTDIVPPYLLAEGNTSSSANAYTSAKFLPSVTYKAVGVNVATTTPHDPNDVLNTPASFWVKDNVDNLWVQTTNTTGFVGFISDVGLNQVWFTSKSFTGVPDKLHLDNFVFSNGTEPDPPPPSDETPDLDTLILCGTGLSILSFVMRLRKRAKA
jgi:hypothetical protein